MSLLHFAVLSCKTEKAAAFSAVCIDKPLKISIIRVYPKRGYFPVYSCDEILTFVEQEDVKFIRLAFCDVAGHQKNIAILPSELPRAFADGISFDASAIAGFGGNVHSDLFLHPDPATLAFLPWRPATGRVVRMYCDIRYPDGRPFERDGRHILRQAVRHAEEAGLTCHIGAEMEFYLFCTDENGEPTKKPFDRAGYCDIAPEDRCENVRREICLTLLDMGIRPESSHHEEGPGQNEIDFRYNEPLRAADDTVTVRSVVRTIATRSGLWADFSPKPLAGEAGSGMHINLSVSSADGVDRTAAFMAGILHHTPAMTAVLNPTADSYQRLGEHKAPRYISWSPQNRSQLIRIPAAKGDFCRIELRSPDPTANPYPAYALLIEAGLDGIRRGLVPAEAVDRDLFADPHAADGLETLPASLDEAVRAAAASALCRRVLPDGYTDSLIRP